MLQYQLVRRDGLRFGSPIATSERLLKLLTPRTRAIMSNLGMRVILVEV